MPAECWGRGRQTPGTLMPAVLPGRRRPDPGLLFSELWPEASLQDGLFTHLKPPTKRRCPCKNKLQDVESTAREWLTLTPVCKHTWEKYRWQQRIPGHPSASAATETASQISFRPLSLKPCRWLSRSVSLVISTNADFEC